MTNSSSGERPPVTSIFDLIFPRSGDRPGLWGIDDLPGWFQKTIEWFGNFWNGRSNSKIQAWLGKIFDEMKEKASQVWQDLAQKNSGPIASDMPIVTPRASAMMNDHSSAMADDAPAASGVSRYISPPSSSGFER